LNHIAGQNDLLSTEFSAQGTIAVTLMGGKISYELHRSKYCASSSHITFHMDHSGSFMFKPPVSKVIPFPTSNMF
jgi:hypothetical protein